MLKIRKACINDAKAAWEIRNTAILDQATGHYNADTLKIWTSGEPSDEFINDVANNFHVAASNDTIVAIGKIDLDRGTIDAIFVRPGYMRQGIGRKIFTFLENIALNHGLKTLSLDATLNAAAFYRACGFTGNQVGTYNSPRGISLDCIPMVKHLGHG